MFEDIYILALPLLKLRQKYVANLQLGQIRCYTHHLCLPDLRAIRNWRNHGIVPL